VKTYLLVSSIVLLASTACFATANATGLTPADTTVCLVPPAPESPCVPRFNLNPPYPRKRAKTQPQANVAADSQRDRSSLTPVLAESARNMMVTSPGQTGSTDIEVGANGTRAMGQLRNMGVSLPAPKSKLK
jgi:hypothetical protein